jgi:hypothetical protein
MIPVSKSDRKHLDFVNKPGMPRERVNVARSFMDSSRKMNFIIFHNGEIQSTCIHVDLFFEFQNTLKNESTILN